MSPDQTVAYRDFPAICDNQDRFVPGPSNAPSNTAMRARVHNYSGQRFVGFVQATCECYYV